MMNTISNIALVLSLAGQVLIAKKSRLAFPMWILSNVCWIVINIMGTFNVQQVIMYVVYTGINLYSWYSWIKEEKNKEKESDDRLTKMVNICDEQRETIEGMIQTMNKIHDCRKSDKLAINTIK